MLKLINFFAFAFSDSKDAKIVKPISTPNQSKPKFAFLVYF